MKKTKAMTVLNVIFLIVYMMFAAVQYNDPDALLWLALYLGAAAMCVAQLRKTPTRWFPPMMLAITVVWAGLLLPSIVGKVTPAEILASVSMQTKAVEEAREIGGLLVVAFWAAVLTYRQRVG